MSSGSSFYGERSQSRFFYPDTNPRQIGPVKTLISEEPLGMKERTEGDLGSVNHKNNFNKVIFFCLSFSNVQALFMQLINYLGRPGHYFIGVSITY